MHVGIDLGTTNSTLATFDGETIAVVPNALGENLTPSVVRIDARGGITVGRSARRSRDGDPGNTAAEFKRLMGTAERLRFDGASRSLLPEELAAEVLRSLLADAHDALGFAPRAAVISTPALFELPQNHATVRAGKLAGLEEVVLIQEPIASAIAAGWRAEHRGLWMVFDLGGGTLDVSLLETDGGRLRVVDHAGDNFLGGKDIDGALADWALDRLGRGLDAGGGGGSGGGDVFRARLRAACEQAKIELSRAQRASIVVPAEGPGEGELELPIMRSELEGLMAPLLDRCLAVVRGVLEKNQRAAAEVSRVVMVGGPTLMPVVRARVAEVFGGRLADGFDPMTIVARGAALFAATVGLDARPSSSSSAAASSSSASSAAAPARAGSAASPARDGLALRIEHPPVTTDIEPFVVGRFLPAAGQALPHRVRVEREDGGFASADIALSAQGSFVVQVRLVPKGQSRFRVRALDREGAAVVLATDRFGIIHGLSVADPPLSRSVGIACADDGTQVYFPKGTPLPARRTFVHETVRAVWAKGGEDALAIPVVQGESLRAHRNRLIGMLRLTGIGQDLPAGSRVEVTLQLDRSGQLHTRADVPAIGRTFEDLAHVLVPTATLETIERELEAVGRRAGELQRRTFEARVPAAVEALGGVVALLAEADRSLGAARGGDADAAQKLGRLLLDAGAALDDAEAIFEWPELADEARRFALTYTPLVAEWGTPSEQQLFDQALAAAGAAQRARNAVELERHLEAMRAIGKASYCRDPRSLSRELEWVAANVTQAVDVARASEILERARAADAGGNRAASRAVLAEIWSLFPTSAEEQRRSFGSGVR